MYNFDTSHIEFRTAVRVNPSWQDRYFLLAIFQNTLTMNSPKINRFSLIKIVNSSKRRGNPFPISLKIPNYGAPSSSGKTIREWTKRKLQTTDLVSPLAVGAIDRSMTQCLATSCPQTPLLEILRNDPYEARLWG